MKALFTAGVLILALMAMPAAAQQSNPPSDQQSVQQPATTTAQPATTTAQPADANRTPATPSQADQNQRRTDTSDPNANVPSTTADRQQVGTAGQATAQDPNQNAQRTNEQNLPATGSPIPLMLLGAFSAFAAAGGLRIARR